LSGRLKDWKLKMDENGLLNKKEEIPIFVEDPSCSKVNVSVWGFVFSGGSRLVMTKILGACQLFLSVLSTYRPRYAK